MCAVPGSADQGTFDFVNPRPDRSVQTHGAETQMYNGRDAAAGQTVLAHLGATHSRIANPHAKFQMMHGGCFANVEHLVREHGGKAVLGWSLYENEFMLEAEAHAVWEDPEGELYNVTLGNTAEATSVHMFIHPEFEDWVVQNGELNARGHLHAINTIYWKSPKV